MISNHTLSHEAGNINNRDRFDAQMMGTCVGIKLARTHKRAACDVLGAQICCMHLRW